MNKKELEEKHLLTKKEIHDSMVNCGYLKYKELMNTGFYGKDGLYEYDAKKLSNLVDQYINYVDKKQEEECIFIGFKDFMGNKHCLEFNNPAYLYAVKNQWFCKYKDNKYFYWTFDEKISDADDYKNNIDVLSCILENYKDLGKYEKHLKYTLEIYKRLLRELNDFNDPNRISLKFKEYDYVKVLNCKSRIAYDDVKQCMYFLVKNNGLTLSSEERLCLNLIILNGIKNIYFNYSKKYIYQLGDTYNSVIEYIDSVFRFIESDKKNIVEEKLYSKDYGYYINLKQEIQLYETVVENHYAIMRRYSNDDYLKEPLQLIHFEYLIKNKKYEEARRFIDNNNIYLYNNIEFILKPLEKSKKKYNINLLIENSLTDYNLWKHDVYDHIDNSFDDDGYNNGIVVPVLGFIINYLYLLKAEKQDKKVEYLYDFLKFFNKGFGIDDFIIKYEYEKALSKLVDFKIEDNNVDIDNIDDTINTISKKIDDLNMVNTDDIDNIKTKYPYINFDNLDERVKKYVATGDSIMRTFENEKNTFDYSSAVIEWSKAVELETYKKLTQKVEKYEKTITNNINNNNKNKKSFKFRDTIGVFLTISRITMKDGRMMSEFLFDEYYSKIYDFDKKQYEKLIDNILNIVATRNDSAHKYTSISYDRAQECQSIILSAKKILAILSNLNEKNNNL